MTTPDRIDGTPASGQAMLDARGLTVRRGGRALIEGVDLRLLPGELLVIIGPNGAGKSTLLRSVSGELTPDAGRVSLGGRPLGHWDPGDRARRLAVLRQKTRLTFPLTVRDVVDLGRLPHEGHGVLRNRAIVDAALACVGMEDFGDRRFPTLSGGEQRLVDLARALAQVWDGGQRSVDPATPHPGGALLLLDEPTAGLDLSRADLVAQTVRRLADRGLGACMVLHDINLAASVADRLLVLREGRVHADGPPSLLSCALLEEVWGLPFSRLDGQGVPSFVPQFGARVWPSTPNPLTQRSAS